MKIHYHLKYRAVFLPLILVTSLASSAESPPSTPLSQRPVMVEQSVIQGTEVGVHVAPVQETNVEQVQEVVVTVAPITTVEGGNGGSATATSTSSPTAIGVEGGISFLVEKSLTPHQAFVPPSYSQPVFTDSQSLSGSSAEFQYAILRLCGFISGEMTMAGGASRTSKVSYKAFPAPEASLKKPELYLLEQADPNQRFRCVGSIAVEAKYKRSGDVYMHTIISDLHAFSKKELRGGEIIVDGEPVNGLWLLADPICFSRNAGITTSGRGFGGSSGITDIVGGNSIGTLLGGANFGKGNTFNVSQLGVSGLLVVPTTEKGRGTFLIPQLRALLDEEDEAQ